MHRYFLGLSGGFWGGTVLFLRHLLLRRLPSFCLDNDLGGSQVHLAHGRSCTTIKDRKKELGSALLPRHLPAFCPREHNGPPPRPSLLSSPPAPL